jgi:hypothetical protein
MDSNARQAQSGTLVSCAWPRLLCARPCALWQCAVQTRTVLGRRGEAWRDATKQQQQAAARHRRETNREGGKERDGGSDLRATDGRTDGRCGSRPLASARSQEAPPAASPAASRTTREQGRKGSALERASAARTAGGERAGRERERHAALCVHALLQRNDAATEAHRRNRRAAGQRGETVKRRSERGGP